MFNGKSRTLVAGLCLVILTGCGSNYLAEREFYKAKKYLHEIDQTEGVAGLPKAIQAFEQVVSKYPSTPKAQESLQLISNMHLKLQQYSQARDAMTRIIESFASSKDKVADARYRVGQIYELEGNWDAAKVVYWELAEYNPLHIKGLYAPIRILLHYKQAGDAKEFKKNQVKALDYYEGLLKQVGPIDSSSAIKNYLAMTYMISEDYEKAITLWLSIQENFPQSPFAPMSLLAAAELQWARGEVEKGEALYDQYFKAYPKHMLVAQTVVGIAMRHHQDKNFVKAREWYQKALAENFKDEPGKKAEIKLLMAKTYQDEVMWDEADAIYKEIESEFENSTAALQIPLMRANYFKSIGEEEKSTEILDGALKQYQDVELESSDQKVLQFTKRVKAAALAQKGEWDDLVAEVERHMNEETIDVRKGRWLFLKALLTQNRLNKPEAAAGLFQEFLTKYPEHPLAPRARLQLEGLTVPKS